MTENIINVVEKVLIAIIQPIYLLFLLFSIENILYYVCHYKSQKT